MKNSYFQFKQFIVRQEKSSMKVCTDSCLFGAWVAKILEEKQIAPNMILDIGTGTGLLSLMLAQKTNATIDAVEINKLSFDEAEANFAESQWSSRLQVYHSDLKDYQTDTKYDLIISNPPFFENDLISINSGKNFAKHHAGLTLVNLLAAVTKLIAFKGYFAVLLPYHRIDNFINSAKECGLFLQGKMLVKQTPNHPFFRGMVFLGRDNNKVTQKTMTIKNTEQEYSNDFISLLGDYYLKL
ncbi:MAG: methyltransferase [Ginsengibacter sp.]